MNVLYCYYEEGKFDKDVILFRIEGEANDLMVDKERERLYMQVNKVNTKRSHGGQRKMNVKFCLVRENGFVRSP